MMWQEDENGYLSTWDFVRHEWVEYQIDPCRHRPQLRIVDGGRQLEG
jgi:hypothetical protein